MQNERASDRETLLLREFLVSLFIFLHYIYPRVQTNSKLDVNLYGLIIIYSRHENLYRKCVENNFWLPGFIRVVQANQNYSNSCEQTLTSYTDFHDCVWRVLMGHIKDDELKTSYKHMNILSCEQMEPE